jgi:hypothetical protein
VGSLQVAFTAPADVVQVTVALYEGNDASGSPIITQIIPQGQTGVLWTDLTPGYYHVTAQAVDGEDEPIYQGQGNIAVEQEEMGLLYLVLIQMSSSVDGNGAPRIESVAVAGHTVLARLLDSQAGSDLYVAASDEDQPITFTAGISDPDGDPVSLYWAVKDGPRITASDKGTILQAVNENLVWQHDVEGKYWVQLYATDDTGASAAFTFNVYVWRGQGDLQLDLEFNSYPSIAIEGFTREPEEQDLSDGWIWLTGTVSDPNGDTIISSNWTLDCEGAIIANYYNDLEIGILPVDSEICTATLTAADSLGFNQATYRMDIRCVPVSVPGSYATSARPLNICSLALLDPLDPLEGQCYINDWECGVGINSWDMHESCGVCPPTGRPDDVVCNADQTCGPCVDVRTDEEVCNVAGAECGTVPDDCGVDRACTDSCVNPAVCQGNTCE